jgi:hypothetical protein
VQPDGPGRYLIEFVHGDPAIAAHASIRLAETLIQQVEYERGEAAWADPALLEAV